MTATEHLLALGLILLLVGLAYGAGRFVLSRVAGTLGLLECLVFAVPVGMGIPSLRVSALTVGGTAK